MSYIALYRKWRPQDFANLVGQEHISRTLANAVKNQKIAHAYLFSGPRGTGKTSTAKIFAKALNCEHGPTASPCNECVNCRKINDGSSMDVFEIDAASNRGIDEMRDLRETVKFAPVDGRYKVYIIDEVHMLTTEAFNALLKTLEEPPPHVVFILATTEAHKVPATIHSRCQRYDFRRITVAEIESRLKTVAISSSIDISDEALHLIAIHADGGLRDALSILDQCSALEDSNVSGESVRRILGLVGYEQIEGLTDALAERSAQTVLTSVDKMLCNGKAVTQILSELALHMRNIMLYQAVKSVEGITSGGSTEKALLRHSQIFSYERLAEIIARLHAAMNECKWSPQPRITLEVALLSICTQNNQPIESGQIISRNQADEGELTERVKQLESRLQQLTKQLSGLAVSSQLETVLPSAPVKNSAVKPSIDDKKANDDSSMTAIVQEVSEPPADDADMPAIWNMLLAELKKKGQLSVFACVSEGWLHSYAGGVLTIAFKIPFLQARTERDDYRNMLEEILRKLSGAPVRVRCIVETPVRVPRAALDTARPPVDSMTPEQRHVVDEAVKMFGDNFVKKDEL